MLCRSSATERPPYHRSPARRAAGWRGDSRVVRRGDPVMRQGVVHVLHVHHVILLIPDAILPGKQVREELGESQTQGGISTQGTVATGSYGPVSAQGDGT